MDQLPRLGQRELICLLLFTCNYVVFVWRGFLFLWVLGMGYVILLWHSLSLPYNYFDKNYLSIIIKFHQIWTLSLLLPECLNATSDGFLHTTCQALFGQLPIEMLLGNVDLVKCRTSLNIQF